jgi:serine/threonine protein kinase
VTNARRPEVTDLVEIGRGGFGVVYRARQEQFRRDVAMKVITATLDARARARFTQECRALGQLSGHPHIVSVYDGGIDPDDHAFLIMPFFARGSLA